MNDLIEALTILNKYMPQDNKWPTHCEHDVLMIVGVDPDDVSEEDTEKLDKLGFFVSDEDGMDHFRSFRFGSA